MPIELLKSIIEAALLAASQPLGVQQLDDLFVEEDRVDQTQIRMALEALAQDCTGRGIELLEVASGFRYQVRQDVHPWISRMWTEKPSRYSRALLETLSLIAYRQPITRPEIEQIRGVVVSSNIIKTLEEREWIRVVGYRDVPGKPALFGTTRIFLDYFNLKSLDELPPLSEIRDMEDPQMRFDQEPLPARIVRDLPIDPDEELEPADLETMQDAVIADHGHAAADDGHDALPSDLTEPPGLADEAAADTVHTEITESGEPAATAPANAESPTATADEAANRADVDTDAAEQDNQEHRA